MDHISMGGTACYGARAQVVATSGGAVSHFLLTCAALSLISLGTMKIGSFYFTKVPGNAVDPVFGLPSRSLLLIAATGEAGIGLAALLLMSTEIKAKLITLVGIIFLSYRLFYFAKGATGECPCLSGARDLFGAVRLYEPQLLLTLALWYTIVGALVFLQCSERLSE